MRNDPQGMREVGKDEGFSLLRLRKELGTKEGASLLSVGASELIDGTELGKELGTKEGASLLSVGFSLGFNDGLDVG